MRLATPLASAIIARAGPHRAVLVALAGSLVGTVVRSAGDARAAIGGTVVLGRAITVGNVVLPVVIGQDLPGHSTRRRGGTPRSPPGWAAVQWARE